MSEWPEKDARLVRVLMSLSPEHLPKEPWDLKASESCAIGRSMFSGGPYVTVTNNKAWLENMKLNASKGPTGPRAKHGAFQEDLRALALLLMG